MPREITSFESCLTASLRQLGFHVLGVELELNQHPKAFPCTVRLRRGTARATTPEEIGQRLREVLAMSGYPLASDQAVVVERRADRYRLRCMLFENPAPFRQPTRNLFRQGRLWRWAGRSIQMVTAWPDLEGRIKKAGEVWQPGCPELPRNYLALRMPELLREELERDGEIDLENIDFDDHGPLDVAQQGCRATVYGQRDRRAREGFVSCEEAAAAFDFSQLVPTRSLKLARRFHEQNFAVLQALSHTHGMEDLISSNPALALAIVRPDLFGVGGEVGRLETQARLIGARRRDALARLGFPGTDAAEHALRKIPAREATIRNLRQLQKILADDAAVLTLGHLPRLNKIQVELLLAGWGVISACALRPILLNKADSQVRRLLRVMRDCLQMSDQLGEDWPPSRPFDGMRSLRRHHDRLMENVYNQAWVPRLNDPFPVAPFPAARGITPITSGLELMEEGREMNHCVVSRIDEVLAGDLFVYKVAEPQRATLAIALHGSTDMPGRANWIFSELQGPGNREVKPETYRHVTAWLRDAGNHEHPHV